MVTVFVSFDGDAIGQKVGRATLTDDVDEVRRVDQAIQKGNEVWKSWALSCGGSVVELGGDEGRLEVPASALSDLEGIRATYSSAVGATVSVGLGRKLSQSAKALMAAKLRGKNRTVMYDESVEKEIAAAQEKTEQQKIGEEYLQKDEGSAGAAVHGHRGRAGAKAPSRDHNEHSEGAEAEKAAEVPSAGPKVAAPDFESKFRALADTQDAQDQKARAKTGADIAGLKAQMADALENLRKQLPMLQQLKSAYPDAYKSILGLVQSTIALGRQLDQQESADPDTMEKSEKCGLNADDCLDDECLEHKEELDPSEPPLPGDTLDKGILPPHATTHRKLALPVGSQHNGEVKVSHADGKSSWKSVRAGQIQGQERDAPFGGQNSHPVSSREPGSK